MTNEGGSAGEMLVGELKFFNQKNGYGFIRHQSQSEDIYLSAKNFTGDIRTLIPGVKLQFKLYQTSRGYGASNVSQKAEKPYKLAVNFDVGRVHGGTFVSAVEIGDHIVYLSACGEDGVPINDAYIFASRQENIKLPDDGEEE